MLAKVEDVELCMISLVSFLKQITQNDNASIKLTHL